MSAEPQSVANSRNQRGNLYLGYTRVTSVTTRRLAWCHTVSSTLKPSHYFLWTNQADYVPAEGGTEDEIGQEIGVSGADDGDCGELLYQTVESVFKPLVVEGVVERGDEGHHVLGNG